MTKITTKNAEAGITTRLNYELICKILEKMNRLEEYAQYLNDERHTHHAALNILRKDMVNLQEQEDVKGNEMEWYKYEYLTNTMGCM